MANQIVDLDALEAAEQRAVHEWTDEAVSAANQARYEAMPKLISALRVATAALDGVIAHDAGCVTDPPCDNCGWCDAVHAKAQIAALVRVGERGK